MSGSVYQTYGNMVRVRACGICVTTDSLLMVNHSQLRKDDFWAPPGGGVEFGESLEECLTREFEEETGLIIRVNEFRFSCEYIAPPLHALEMYFEVTVESGILTLGKDPEMNENQIIKEVKFMPFQEIDNLNKQVRHGIFDLVANSSKIVDLKGHFKL
jgi:8-oxo-dGTP diphosphatase